MTEHSATCPAHLAYRGLADIGPAQVCNRPVTTAGGYCRLHDPTTKPIRDNKGHFLKKGT